RLRQQQSTLLPIRISLRPRYSFTGSREASPLSGETGIPLAKRPDCVVAERGSTGLAVRHELEQRGLGREPVGAVVALSEAGGAPGGGQPGGEALEQRLGGLRRGLPPQRRIEVRDHHVVGLYGLEPAGLELRVSPSEDDRRCRVPNGTVGCGRLALKLGR